MKSPIDKAMPGDLDEEIYSAWASARPAVSDSTEATADMIPSGPTAARELHELLDDAKSIIAYGASLLSYINVAVEDTETHLTGDERADLQTKIILARVAFNTTANRNFDTERPS